MDATALATVGSARQSIHRVLHGADDRPIDKPTPRMRLPLSISRAWGAMAPLYEPRASVLIRSYVHAGTRTRDWLFVDSRDANEWLGLPVSASLITWWVIPGDWWLDHYGRDDGTYEDIEEES